jgi:pyruvate-formate lyase-activating enzyme
MRVRSNTSLRVRAESFGGVVYVPKRDDFFFLDEDTFRLVNMLTSQWREVPKHSQRAYEVLAGFGICSTKVPVVDEKSFSGVALLGKFEKFPIPAQPLVINCFATALCPLKCLYCHADDLMQQFRQGESWRDLENVSRISRQIPSVVAVITGGDPLTRPNRAIYLLESLVESKALVLDTSGVGDIESIMRYLQEYHVHVRVSLDIYGSDNERVRLSNKEFTSNKNASFEGAIRSISSCLGNGVPVSVQTVISSHNDRLSYLRDLRDFLIHLGVRHWVLHIAVEAGKARDIQEKVRTAHLTRGGILPRPSVIQDIARLIRETVEDNLPIDIRTTNTNRHPNSVILIGSTGQVFTESKTRDGKHALHDTPSSEVEVGRIWRAIHKKGHVQRYINWDQPTSQSSTIAERCIKVPFRVR